VIVLLQIHFQSQYTELNQVVEETIETDEIDWIVEECVEWCENAE
jgi:hypothetical protein